MVSSFLNFQGHVLTWLSSGKNGSTPPGDMRSLFCQFHGCSLVAREYHVPQLIWIYDIIEATSVTAPRNFFPQVGLRCYLQHNISGFCMLAKQFGYILKRRMTSRDHAALFLLDHLILDYYRGGCFWEKIPITSRVRWFLLIHSWHRFATYCSVKSFCFRLSWGGKEFQNEHLQNHQVVVCLRKCTIPYHLLQGQLWLTGHVSCSKFAKPFLWIRRCHHQNLSAGEDDKQGGFKVFFVKKSIFKTLGRLFPH